MDDAIIRNLIQQGLPGADVRVGGDGVHFDAHVVSELFAGKSMIGRHQMIYGALGDHMRANIHALSIKALTPAERDEGG